ncbi:CAP domain-containing protein [Micromonospora sp. DT47]|uniref:CAP domain-containing protein n=1 Tax=Micromonospora sp. DT47 TaxID=3393431 RepID=UPI003CF1C011
MEATGVYGWTDPDDPDGAHRRPQPPTDEPAWLSDRPEPRSAYLFGDEPGQPGEDRWADAPTGRYEPLATEPASYGEPYAGHAPYAGSYGEPYGGYSPYAEPEDRTAVTPPVDLTADREATAFTPAVAPFEGATGWSPTAEPAADQEGRHRQKRRFPRPLVIGGAAAAATLVVSLGIGALVLTGGDEDADRASFDDTVAAAPVVPGLDATPGDALSPTASPTASPTTARPTPSPSRTVKPAPAPARTTGAPSRRSTTREGSARPTGTGTGTGTTLSGGAGVSSQAKQVVDLVNAERAKAGCNALKIDDKLMLAAQRHSQDQADHQDMTHTGSDGSDAGERLDRVGYSWRTYGENVAWNQKTPAAVMDAWMNSPDHRDNILNCAFTQIGVGVATSNGPYWTQDFAAPR